MAAYMSVLAPAPPPPPPRTVCNDLIRGRRGKHKKEEPIVHIYTARAQQQQQNVLFFKEAEERHKNTLKSNKFVTSSFKVEKERKKKATFAHRRHYRGKKILLSPNHRFGIEITQEKKFVFFFFF